MKFLDYLFHGKELRYIDSYFKMLNGYSPTFTSYNGGVYEMDLTRTKSACGTPQALILYAERQEI